MVKIGIIICGRYHTCGGGKCLRALFWIDQSQFAGTRGALSRAYDSTASRPWSAGATTRA